MTTGVPGLERRGPFERYEQNGGTVLAPADYYEAPGAPGGPTVRMARASRGDSTALGGSDHGRYIVLKSGGPADAIAPGLVSPGR